MGPRVLISEGASLSARHTLFALGHDSRVDVLDPGRFRICRFSKLVDRWYRCPSYARNPLEFLSFLSRHLQRHSYDVLMPTHEEIYLLSRVQDRLNEMVSLAVPPFEALDQLQSKARFVELLNRLEIPVPRTVFVRTQVELESIDFFPCFVKLAYSTASCGVWRIEDRAQLKEVAQQLFLGGSPRSDDQILVQARASGIESAAIGLFQHGTLVGYHCFEEWAKGSLGMPMARVSADHPRVMEHVRRIGDHLRWHGPFCLGYFYDPETGKAEYIEANPRIGETFNSVPSGNNLCRLWIRIAQGERVEPQLTFKTGVRTYCGFLVLLAKALDGAGRGELAKELVDWWQARGYFCGGESELTRPREDWLSVLPSLGVNSLLLAYPQASRWIVSDTVGHYALPDSTARDIREFSEECLVRAMS